jgi:hypothetical protein
MHSTAAVDHADTARRHLREAVEALDRCAEAGLSSRELTTLLSTTAAQRNQLDSAFTRLVGCLDETIGLGEDADDPASSCAAFLRDELRMTNNAAWAQVHLARQLRVFTGTADAFSDGVISSQHAMAITRTLDRIVRDGHRGNNLAGYAEATLLEWAGEHNPTDLLMAGKRLRHEIDPRDLAQEEDEERRRAWLTLKTALDAEMGPEAKDDKRPAAHRRAEALRELLREVLDGGTLPGRGGVRPHLVVTASVQTLRGELGSPAGLMDWLFPVSSEFVRGIAEDADLTPMLVDGAGNPLYVGRTRRTATKKVRLAPGLRDRRCAWPGCDRPPSWCEGNHEDPWRAGGKTNLDRLRLYCRLHHRKHDAGRRRN